MSLVSTKIYIKRGDLDFDIGNIPVFDDDVFWRPSYGVYIISTYSLCLLTVKLFKQGYWYH